ncbi:MAG TPA: histidine phosphatase family protein [Kiloniellaceae bacterium]
MASPVPDPLGRLSERGIDQVRQFRAFVRALNPALVVTSDLDRTRQTAELIGHGDSPADPRLREWHMGCWTGRTKPELIAAHADLYHAWRAGEYTPEGGETWEAFRARVAEGLRHWLAAGQGDLLAVVHGGVIRAALHAFVGLPPARVIPVTPGTGTLLDFSPGCFETARLEGYNIGAVVPDLWVAD